MDFLVQQISEAILLCSHLGKQTEDGSVIEMVELGISPSFSITLSGNKNFSDDWSKSRVTSNLIGAKDARLHMARVRAGRAFRNLNGGVFSHLGKCAIALSQLGKEFEYQKLMKTLVLEKVEITIETINHFLVDKTDSSKSMTVLSKIENCDFSRISEGDQMYATTLQRKWYD